MILTLLHYLSFSVAVGGGLAAILLLSRLIGQPDTAPVLRPVLMALSRLGVAVLTLLWLTGISMWIGRYAQTSLGASWHLKLTGAVLLTALAVYGFYRLQIGRPLPPRLARAVLILQLALATAVIAAAIWTFG